MLHLHTIASNAVVAAGLAGRVGKQGPTSLYAGIARHAVNGNGVDYMVAPPGMVRGSFGVGYKWAVTHPLLTPFKQDKKSPACSLDKPGRDGIMKNRKGAATSGLARAS